MFLIKKRVLFFCFKSMFLMQDCFLFKIILPIYFSYPVIDTGMGGGGGGFAVFTLQPSGVSPGPGPVRVCSFEWGGAGQMIFSPRGPRLAFPMFLLIIKMNLSYIGTVK